MTTSAPADPTAVLYLATWLSPDLHAEFSAWCDDHHREQLALPGFQRARRFEWRSSRRDDDPPQYLTMYDLDSLEALHSAEYLEHMNSSPGLPDFLRGHLRLQRRDCTVIAALPTPWWPPSPSSLLDVFQLNDDALAVGLREEMSHLHASVESGISLRLIDSDNDEPLVLIDHGDDDSKLIDTITAASGSLRSSWRCCFDEQA